MKNPLLLGSALASTLGGGAAIALGITGWPATPDAGSIATVLTFSGFVTLFVGVYALITWFALAAPDPAAEHLALADRYAAAGKVEYARTYYEEALLAGADPDEVEARLARCVAAAQRASVHRERPA